MNANKIFLFFGAFVIGIIAGLRSLTAPAAVSWAAHLGWIDLRGSRLAFLGSTVAVIVLSVLALGELVTDKLAFTPNRTSLLPLSFRVVSGAVCGAAVCISAQHFVVLGSVLGAVGAIVGAFSGYRIRHNLVKKGSLPDIAVAVMEDAVAVGGAFLLVSHLY
jgi:uncharacterized membrane protein